MKKLKNSKFIRILVVSLCLLCLLFWAHQTQAEEQHESNTIAVFSTGYNAEEGFGSNTRTSNGTVPDWGTIAVDPRIIPYGSIVFSQKYADLCGRYGIALDCGSAIKGLRIDWWTETQNQSYAMTGYEQITILRQGWSEWQVDPSSWGLTP